MIAGVCFIIYGWVFVRRKLTPCYFISRHLAQSDRAAVSPEVTEDSGGDTDPAPRIRSAKTPRIGSSTELDGLDAVEHQEVIVDGELVHVTDGTVTPFLRAGAGSQKVRYWAERENFVRSAGEVLYPPTCGLLREYTPRTIREGAFFGLLHLTLLGDYGNFKMIASTLFIALGWAFLATGVSSYHWLQQAHCGGCTHLLGAENITSSLNTDVWDICNDRDFSIMVGKVMSTTYDDYKFFPIFLLVGYTGYLVSKFKDWMVNCHTVQARIHDIGVLVGGAIMTPDEPATREKVFEVYRLMNLIHTLTYMDHTLEFCRLNYSSLVEIGLMTNVEFELIAPYREEPKVMTKNKARDMALSWLSSELMNLIQDGIVHETYGEQISKNVAGLRGICARHHDLFLRDNPNVYLSTMLLTCDYLLVMIITGMPLTTCIYVPGASVAVFQWSTLVCVFMLLSAFMLSQTLANILRDPFLTKRGHDDITNQTGMKLDDLIDCRALIHSTDCCIFAQLRANFDRRSKEIDERQARIDSKIQPFN